MTLLKGLSWANRCTFFQQLFYQNPKPFKWFLPQITEVGFSLSQNFITLCSVTVG